MWRIGGGAGRGGPGEGGRRRNRALIVENEGRNFGKELCKIKLLEALMTNGVYFGCQNRISTNLTIKYRMDKRNRILSYILQNLRIYDNFPSFNWAHFNMSMRHLDL